MFCPYHPDQPVQFDVPADKVGPEGLTAWLGGCCGLPVWICPEGLLQPIEARYCVTHGEERPHPERQAHELGLMPPPRLVRRSLELPAMSDGLSAPCLAGNVLVYLTEKQRLVALDMGSDATVFLAEDVLQASLRVERGMIRAALRIRSGVRYLAWDVRDVREALADYTEVSGQPTGGAGSNLLGLPFNRTRLHVGAGLVRLVVEHDPVEDALAETYHAVTGSWPGPWLIRRTANPKGPPVHDIDIRPQDLWQVPVPIPGGVLMLGVLRVRGAFVAGALVLPNLGAVA